MSEDFKDRLSRIGRPGGGPTRTRRKVRPKPARLEELAGVVRTDGVLVVDRSVGDLATPDSLAETLSAIERTGRTVGARGDIEEEVRTLLGHPEGALFIDTETTGLAGNLVFLLGAMRIENGDVRLTQVFARDYREERALLEAWVEMLSRAEMLVSFNGKSFDMPILRDRLGYHGLESPDEPPHLDLLHPARRRWREVLPDCRLQTLEWRLCGRKRAGDIPGEEIPGVYHHFVRTGEMADILTVFHHNALDLITLADIALALSAPEDDPA